MSGRGDPLSLFVFTDCLAVNIGLVLEISSSAFIMGFSNSGLVLEISSSEILRMSGRGDPLSLFVFTYCLVVIIISYVLYYLWNLVLCIRMY